MISQAPACEEDMVFVREQVAKMRLDPERLEASQFTIFWDDDRIVAFGRVKPYEDGSYELGGVGVVEDARGNGIGELVVRTLIHAFPVEDVWITTDLPGWFERFGFVRARPEAIPRSLAAKLATQTVRDRDAVVAMHRRR
jgi:N-acetylglutamate synthase-like GNAT family acetyltransferase